MSLSVKVLQQGNKFNQLVKRIRNLANESVEVGHFAQQGTHHSGMSYPELMRLHHTGGSSSGVPIPPRPVQTILKFRNTKLAKPGINKAFRDYAKRKSNRASTGKLLSDIGVFLRDEEKKIFGSPDLAPNAVPPKDRNNPLIVTGDLKNKVAYRTSMNKSIKEG